MIIRAKNGDKIPEVFDGAFLQVSGVNISNGRTFCVKGKVRVFEEGVCIDVAHNDPYFLNYGDTERIEVLPPNTFNKYYNGYEFSTILRTDIHDITLQDNEFSNKTLSKITMKRKSFL